MTNSELNTNQKLLDEFAGQAMTALVHQTQMHELKARDVELIARNSYRIAQEMLRVRQSILKE